MWADLQMGMGALLRALPFSSPLGHLEKMSGSASWRTGCPGVTHRDAGEGSVLGIPTSCSPFHVSAYNGKVVYPFLLTVFLKRSLLPATQAGL